MLACRLRRHMDGDEAVCGNCASQRDQQRVRGTKPSAPLKARASIVWLYMRSLPPGLRGASPATALTVPPRRVQAPPSEAGSGRSTASDTFSTSHVIPAAVEARAGPKLGRITPFPLDRTAPPPARSLAEGRKSQSPALTALTED